MKIFKREIVWFNVDYYNVEGKGINDGNSWMIVLIVIVKGNYYYYNKYGYR